MLPAGWTLLALGVAMLCLDAYAVWKVFASSFYGPAQRWAQTALILLVPIAGAWLALYMCREDVPLFQSPPGDHVWDIDPAGSDIGHHGCDHG